MIRQILIATIDTIVSKTTWQSTVAHSTDKHKLGTVGKGQTRWRKQCDQRDGGGELLLHPLRSLDYYWLIKYFYLTI